MAEQARQQQQHRVRKRAPNACSRCRQQKIRCSGTAPCAHCIKRNQPCDFNSDQQKVVVTRGFIQGLERQAGVPHQQPRHSPEQRHVRASDGNDTRLSHNLTQTNRLPTPTQGSSSRDAAHSDSEQPSRRESAAVEENLTNPLVSGRSVYVADPAGQPSLLGTSSNWSFGRRILSNAHERVYGMPLPATGLVFEGQTYDLGWDGRRTSASINEAILPTADFALFLINAVKFHCGQLFHLFDEHEFMRRFNDFYSSGSDRHSQTGDDKDLWYIQYLLILALGKALIVRVGQDRKSPGADLYAEAMRILPDTMYLVIHPIQSIETLCCAALYLHCLDMRAAAHSVIGQALRMAIGHGIHTDIQSRHHSDAMVERSREIWWTVYVLDCNLSASMGAPPTIAEQHISAQLPAFAASPQKSLALSIHVKLAKATTTVLGTVYGEEGRTNNRFLASIKTVLKSVAEIHDERNTSFPLNLRNSQNGISRLSAYLHLFHHQCIMLTIRPLLYALWQKRIGLPAPMRVSSAGGVRTLMRVCIASAQESMRILTALQAQSLLESFLPFDLDSTWSSAVVLLVTQMVDPSLLRKDDSWIQTTHSVLDEMVSRGNLIASLRKNEFQQLMDTLAKLHTNTTTTNAASNANPQGVDMSPVRIDHQAFDAASRDYGSSHSHLQYDPLGDWNSEEGLTGNQLMGVADSLDFTNLDWLSSGPFGPLDISMH